MTQLAVLANDLDNSNHNKLPPALSIKIKHDPFIDLNTIEGSINNIKTTFIDVLIRQKLKDLPVFGSLLLNNWEYIILKEKHVIRLIKN